jgi:bifunctional UDP-N-acetylglucosamine pyrophosphorylase/glucosamine-1-phosphate N-acetyltransferase
LKAVLLAAGKGSRLEPLTESRPKHLLPVGGRPLLEWMLRGLAGIGIEEVLVVTHHMEEQIKDRFQDGGDLGLELSYIRQVSMDGTAGAFKVAEEFTGSEEFIGIYGDLYVSEENFGRLISSHTYGQLTMGVVYVDNPSQMGVVELNGNRIMSLVEKSENPPSNIANAALYVFPPRIFEYISKTGLSSRGELEITDSIQMMIDDGEPVLAAELDREGWLDVGRPWDLLEANRRSMTGLESRIEGTLEEGVNIHGSIIVEKGARVRSGAYIEGPVYIGPGCDVGPNCYLRPSTYLVEDVRVGNACEIKNSIIMKDTHIAHLSYVGDSIIGGNCNLGAGTITANIRFDKKNVKVTIKDKREDSGRRKMGTIMGDNSQTGINVNLLPGVKVGSKVWIAPGLTVSKDVPSGVFLRG